MTDATTNSTVRPIADTLAKMIPAAVVGYSLNVRWQTLVRWGKDPDNPFPKPYRYANAWHFKQEAVDEWLERQGHTDGPDLRRIRTP